MTTYKQHLMQQMLIDILLSVISFVFFYLLHFFNSKILPTSHLTCFIHFLKHDDFMNISEFNDFHHKSAVKN